MKNVRRTQVLALLTSLSVMLLTGCSHGSSSAGAAAPLPSSSVASSASPDGTASPDDGASTGTATSSDPSGGSSTGATGGASIRFVNLFDPKGVAGPALDIYAVQLTGQPATPVVTDLAYGAVSSYVSPALTADVTGGSSANLYALPTGEDPVAKMADAQGIGAILDDGSHPQLTSVLTADTGDNVGGALAGLSFSSHVENGTFNGSTGPVAPPPPAGKAEILVDTSAILDSSTLTYLMIDASCDPPLNGDKTSNLPYAFAVDGATPVSSFAVFATSPGTHQVSVVAWPQGTPPTCAQLTKKQGTSSVQVSAGQQVEAYVYGSSATDLHLALAPVR